ncbi:MAG: SIR2 family protein [Chloroflexi bacterium]|nr:SIR2 family protein [Chloroflexota bacterium]MCY3695904.1 SIR2 family protein [Chloroflexota bacterium]
MGLPPEEDPAFYSEVFERAYPNASDRATFIESQVQGASPNHGHQVLAALVAADRLRLILTTNFDPLLERAINPLLDSQTGDVRQLEIADLDNPNRARRALETDRWPLLVKIHGDYRSEHLKNISAELRNQDAELRRTVTSALTRFGLVVAGYSGRDDSVMSMLRDVLTLATPYPAGIVWVKRPQDDLPPSVTSLLSDARTAGVETSVVTATTFVDLVSRLEQATSLPQPVRSWLAERSSTAVRRAEPAPVGPTGAAPVLQLNALPVAGLPREARKLEWSSDPVPLDRLRKSVSGPEHDALVGIARGTPVAFGRDSELSAALAAYGVQVSDARVSLDAGADPTEEVDTQAVGIVTDALIVGLARQRGLRPVLRRKRPHLLRVMRPDAPALSRLSHACGGRLRGEVRDPQSGLRLPWAEAVAITLERRQGQWWLLFDPEIWTRRLPLPREDMPDPTTAELDALSTRRKEFIRERTAKRYNRQMGEIMMAWTELLTGGGRVEVRTFALSSDEGVDAVTVLNGSAAMSLPMLARQDLGPS